MIRSQSFPTGNNVVVMQQPYTAYNLPRRFKPDSRLHALLAMKAPEMIEAATSEYTLYVVLSALRQVISRERLYDPNNTTVIICSTELEEAIGMKYLHVTEVRDVVLTQMEVVSPALLASLTSLKPSPPPHLSQPRPLVPDGQQQGQQQQGKFDVDGQYWLKPAFLKVLRLVKGVDATKVVFSYREVTSYLSQYILDNKDKFFDERNIRIANVSEDPLGEAFNVKVFHRTQVTALLRNQLIPYKPNGAGLSVPPNPPNDDSARKRSSSDSEDQPQPQRRARRRSSRGGSISITVIAHRDSDEETIHSAQGYSTCPVVGDSNNDDHETSNDFDVYDIEYEPEGASSDEDDTVRNDNKADSSDDNESDLDIPTTIVVATAMEILENCSYDDDADESSDNEDDPTKADLENTDTWTCLDCNQPNTPYIRYCSACYKERKGWLPERPKPKKRKANGDSKIELKILSVDEEKPKYERSLSEEKSTEDEAKSSSQDSGFSQEMSDEEAAAETVVKMNPKSKSFAGMSMVGGICSLCCAQPKNACLIHGRISHQVCCYGCAKKLFKNRRGCPVCRRRIEKITKNIIA